MEKIKNNSLPVWEYNLALQLLFYSLLHFHIVTGKSYNMRSSLDQAASMLSSHGQCGANDGIFIPGWKVGAGQINAGKYQSWIWGEGARWRLFAFQQRLLHPSRCKNWNHTLTCISILRKIVGGGNDVGDGG
jgi:hypothetical protein